MGPRSFGHFVPTHRRSLQRNDSTRSHLASHSNCPSRRHVTPQREEIGGVADALFSEASAGLAYVTGALQFSAKEKQKLRKTTLKSASPFLVMSKQSKSVKSTPAAPEWACTYPRTRQRPCVPPPPESSSRSRTPSTRYCYLNAPLPLPSVDCLTAHPFSMSECPPSFTNEKKAGFFCHRRRSVVQRTLALHRKSGNTQRRHHVVPRPPQRRHNDFDRTPVFASRNTEPALYQVRFSRKLA